MTPALWTNESKSTSPPEEPASGETLPGTAVVVAAAGLRATRALLFPWLRWRDVDGAGAAWT